VFFFEAFEEEERALRAFLPATVAASFTDRTIQESGIVAPPCSVISIRTQSIVPQDWAPKIKAILARSTGYDHLQTYRNATGAPIAYGYLPSYCARSVAEHAMLLWMGLMRKLPLQVRHMSRFRRNALTGGECKAKCLLVVGVGNIGCQVARIGEGLDMSVHGVDIVQRYPEIDYVTIDEGLAAADVLVCAMNLTSDNERYFRYQVLRNCKKGLIFVNVARGEFSPAPDLVRLLDEERLGGVGLDVYNSESLIAENLRQSREASDGETLAVRDLSGRANVILTPHNAFNTSEALRRKAEQSMIQAQCFLEHGKFKWPVP